MFDTSPRLELPYLMPSQAQKHITVNESLLRLDALVQLTLTTMEAVTPPGSPSDGETHALGAAPTGDWSGQGGTLAMYDGTGWQFISPVQGWMGYDVAGDRLMSYDGSAWQQFVPSMDNLDGVGINTSSDGTNRLSVSAPATLLSHEGAGHQLKINKAASGDTASVLFQSAWTGHAEMGLAGDTAFAVKLSADGSSWIDALKMDAGAGTIAMAPAGTTRATLSDSALTLDVPLGGTAVQADALDATAGRMMPVGAFGLGGTDSSAVALSDGNSALATGFYGGSGVGAANFPGNGAEAQPVLALNARSGAGAWSSVRMFFQSDATPVLRASTDNGQTWGADTTLFGSANLLATVGQSGGVPTGGVIERGTGAEGDYVRFADGTQICTLTRVATVTTAPSGALHMDDASFGTWTFAAAFSEAPVVSAQVQGGQTWANAISVSTTATAGLSILSTLSEVGAVMTVRVMAVGRWI